MSDCRAEPRVGERGTRFTACSVPVSVDLEISVSMRYRPVGGRTDLPRSG